jgi:DNA-3-methyladenine glycosylase I
MAGDERRRCEWVGTDPLNIEYHDLEWGAPSRDRGHLFEMLTLEGAQAGLSWMTILRKREGYRTAFLGFEPERVAALGLDDIDRLMLDPGIVRNRAKIESTIDNARAALELDRSGAGFVEHLWSFVGGRPIDNGFTELAQLPSETAESKAMSKDLKARGFRFVGPTTCYSLMQATGLVNDHTTGCFRYREVGGGLA